MNLFSISIDLFIWNVSCELSHNACIFYDWLLQVGIMFLRVNRVVDVSVFHFFLLPNNQASLSPWVFLLSCMNNTAWTLCRSWWRYAFIYRIPGSSDRFTLLRGCSLPEQLLAYLPSSDGWNANSFASLPDTCYCPFCVSHPCGYWFAFLYFLKVHMICKYFPPPSGLLLQVNGIIWISHFKSCDDVLVNFSFVLGLWCHVLKKHCPMKTKNFYGFVFS